MILLQKFTVYSNLIGLCIKSSKPVLFYGETGCGKTTFMDVSIDIMTDLFVLVVIELFDEFRKS
jgi:type IV secretory pathway ATPase VirB11/archaellum biosynthesis ATPase